MGQIVIPNKSNYRVDSVENWANSTPDLIQLTLVSTNWNNKQYVIINEKIRAASNGKVFCKDDDFEAQEIWGIARPRITHQANGTITITCEGVVPTQDIRIFIELFNKLEETDSTPAGTIKTLFDYIQESRSLTKHHTLVTSKWNGVQYILEDEDITVAGDGELYIAQSATKPQFDAAQLAMIQVTAQSAGSITLTSRGVVPTIDIPIELILQGILKITDTIEQRFELIEAQLPLFIKSINSKTPINGNLSLISTDIPHTL